MTHALQPVPDPPPPRHRGRIGQWSDKVKALALLVLLAVAGGVMGLPGAEAERPRDGMSAGGPAARAALPDTSIAPLATDQERRLPAAAGGDDGPMPQVLAGAVPSLPVRRLPAASPIRLDEPARPPARAGHEARMPTGPPVRLSA